MLAVARIVRGVKAARRIYERRGEKRVGRGMGAGRGLEAAADTFTR